MEESCTREQQHAVVAADAETATTRERGDAAATSAPSRTHDARDAHSVTESAALSSALAASPTASAPPVGEAPAAAGTLIASEYYPREELLWALRRDLGGA